MTRDEARTMLKNCNSRPAKLLAFSYVSLTERELLVMQLRYIHGLTQEEVIERLPHCYARLLNIPLKEAIEKYTPCLNSVQNWERQALDKCADIWKNAGYLGRLQRTIQQIQL